MMLHIMSEEEIKEWQDELEAWWAGLTDDDKQALYMLYKHFRPMSKKPAIEFNPHRDHSKDLKAENDRLRRVLNNIIFFKHDGDPATAFSVLKDIARQALAEPECKHEWTRIEEGTHPERHQWQCYKCMETRLSCPECKGPCKGHAYGMGGSDEEKEQPRLYKINVEKLKRKYPYSTSLTTERLIDCLEPFNKEV